MSTVRNMASVGMSSANNAARTELSKLKKELSELGKNSNLTAEEKDAKKKEYTEKIDALNEQISSSAAARQASVSTDMGWMFGSMGNKDQNQTGMDFLYGAGATMGTLKAVNSARLGIENRARTLISEIRMDQLRGVDTTFKREQLSNLTGNLEVMNKNLGSNIDKALADPKTRTADAPSIIDKINADLKKIQEQEEKKVQERHGLREAPKEEAPEAGEKTEGTSGTGTEEKK